MPLPSLVPQAVLAQMDAADGPQAGALESAQERFDRDSEHLDPQPSAKHPMCLKKLSASCANTCLYSAGNAHPDADH